MKYAVIGGAGAMGSITVRDLVETAPAKDEIIIADFDTTKARLLAAQLGRKNVKAVHVDIKAPDKAAKAIHDADIIINCTQYEFNLQVMNLALALKAHYIDLGGLFHMTRKQMGLHDTFREIGKLAVLGVGAAPGITNLLARHGADQLDTVHDIHIRLGSIDKTRYKPVPALGVAYSLKTILEEFSFDPAVFTKGKWKFIKPMSGADPYRFPSPVGVQYPMYTIHSEVANLPVSFADKGIQECTFKIAFPQEFVDKVRFLRDLGMASHEPIDIQGTKVAPVDVINKVAMSQPVPDMVGPMKQYEIVRAIVKGTKEGKKLTWLVDLHTTGIPEWGLGLDVDTGCPPSVVAQLIARGKIMATGALPPELSVPPDLFFAALAKRGMIVKAQCKKGWTEPV